jgi:hypothetical protein
MTEQQWLDCPDSPKMLDWLRTNGVLSERKARLFAVACCRRIWPLVEQRGRRAVEVAERFADALATGAELDAAREEARRWSEVCQMVATYDPFDDGGVAAAEAMALAVEAAQAGFVVCAPERAVAATVLTTTTRHDSWKDRQFASVWTEAKSAAQGAMRGELAGLLRDLFGPLPFRPVTLDPACRTPQVVALAQAAYDQRELPAGALDPARLAVLADAVEEAGCDQADLLSHLRGPGPHVRGCWAVDLVLGKS